MESSPIEGWGEVDIGNGVSNHYKFGFCISYPYLFIYCNCIKLKISYYFANFF